MKNIVKSTICAGLSLLCIAAFSGCSKSDTITQTPNVGVSQGVSEGVGKYASVAYFEQTRPEDVEIKFEADAIRKVSFKYRVLNSEDWSFKNDKLTIKASVFENESSGDKRLRVFVGDKFVEITVRVVSKVILTVDDFNSIRNNLNGVYVLGADIDFGGDFFHPIGKPLGKNESTGVFEGIFDGMGYSVRNLVIRADDRGEGENRYEENGNLIEIQGPSLGSVQGNGMNYGNGIFMSTGGSAQIINTSFTNVSVIGQGLNGAVVGSNGGLIKNCRVTCSLTHSVGGYAYYEKSAGIAGMNGSGDATGRIENCVVVYDARSGGCRGIADWNSAGIIRNCYAALADDYVYHVGYDADAHKVPDNFDYDEWVTDSNWSTLLGYYTIPAFPGSFDTANGIFYKGGDIINSEIVRKEFLMNPANFPEEDGWDTGIWNFTLGAYPSLKIQSK